MPASPKTSEEMKVWSTLLATELREWPGVTTKPFFGFTAVYRKAKIFAALPRTRGVGKPSGLGFKLPSASARLLTQLRDDPRVQETGMQKARWFFFEMESEQDLRTALDWLGEAYAAAGKKAK